MLKKMSYNHVAQPDWLLINRVKIPFMPINESQVIEIPGRRGVHLVGRKKKEYEIEVDVTIMGNTDIDLTTKIEWMAAWLDQPEEAPLTFNHIPERYFQATFSGGSGELEAVAAMGSGTLVFLVPDPYKYGLHVNKSLGSAAGTKTIENRGTAPVQPLFTVNFQRDSNFFGLVSPDGFIQLGQPAAPDETPIPPEERILADPMNDLAPWTASGVTLDYGKASGKFYVESTSRFMVSDWGDADENKTDWHGPVLKRSLPKAIQDFRVMAEIELYTTKEKTGRVEIWLLDTTGAIQGRMILWDRYTNAMQVSGSIAAGNYSSSQPIVHSDGPTKGIWNNFKGRLVIRREGNEWRASISKINQYGREDPTTTAYSYKQINDYLKPIAQIQIAIRKYGATPAPSATIRELHVDQLNKVQEEKKQVPALFKAGDLLEIDNRTGNTWKNGEYFNKYLDPGSTFFKIAPGTTEILASSQNPDYVNITADFDYRYK